MTRLLFVAIAALLPSAAFAHTGHPEQANFLAGLLHPFLGLDHLTAMVAVGVWSHLTRAGRVWLMPAVFVGAMIAGAGVAAYGIEIPAIEALILASLVAVGLAILFRIAAPTLLGGGAIALFAIAHGYAHGAEAPAGGGIGYMAGFSVATALLHVSGIALAWIVSRTPAPLAARALGLVPIAVGVALAAR
ncbi:MAG TPA: HupE/UreJ family protein [Hyphomicrobiaceae bacterium]|nr:HupE/UreJ family protein [Hyphomicrobiaceae bacterium]